MSIMHYPILSHPRLKAIKDEYDKLVDAVEVWEKDLKHAVQQDKETPRRIISHLQTKMIDLDTERQTIYDNQFN